MSARDDTDAGKLAELFARRIGYRFRNPEILVQALTHSAGKGRDARSRDYQRLEFLGDRVLGLVIAEALFRRYPEREEGTLARQLNHLVRKETCADVARNLGLAELMRTGETTHRKQAETSVNVLGDLCESIIAAIYLDGGLEAAKKFIISQWEPLFARYEDAPRDPKSALQEWAAARGFPAPQYHDVARSGPDHAPRFSVEVEVEGLGRAGGVGPSKRKAQQAAAAALLEQQKVDRE